MTILPEDKQKRIEQAIRVVATTRIAALSTVSSGGKPHNTPVFMAFDANFNSVWSSKPDSQHSQNIARTNETFIAVYDSSGEQGAGLYIEAEAHMLLPESPDFVLALQVFKEAKMLVGAPEPRPSDFSRPGGQRLYLAVPTTLWVNYANKDKHGKIIGDERFRVTVAALKNPQQQ